MLRHQALGYAFTSLPRFILSQEIVAVIIPILFFFPFFRGEDAERLHNLPELAQPCI